MGAPILAPIIIAAATTAVGSFFQNRSAKIAARARQLDNELSRANEIFEDATELIDSTYYHLRRDTVFVAVRKAQDDETRAEADSATWRAFTVAMQLWEQRKGLMVAQVRLYFGEDRERQLREIRDGFDRLNTMIESTYFSTRDDVKKASLIDKEGNVHYRKFFKTAGELEPVITDFFEDMLAQIQNQEVGVFRPGSC